MAPQSIAVIGGGLAGLSAAITVAEQGVSCTLFEAAPHLGGRTGSWLHQPSQTLLDHGPHLLLGCYHHLLGLLARAGGSNNIHWQPSLSLPLWSADRGHFSLTPKPWLPLPLALPIAIHQMAGHDHQSLSALLRLAASPPSISDSVQQWLQRHHTPYALVRDMLEPLCLGSMNEGIATANGASFAMVLDQAFSSHQNARIGWFRQSLTASLIAPLAAYAQQLGVTIHTRCRIRTLQPHFVTTSKQQYGSYNAIIVALPAAARNRLLSMDDPIESRSITNYHLWFDQPIPLPSPLIGGIGTIGQWFFDIDAMTNHADATHHCCVVISDDHRRHANLHRTLLQEFGAIAGGSIPAPIAYKKIHIHHATHPVRNTPAYPCMPSVIDACEQPLPGELPATMERAVITGHHAAISALSSSN